MRALKVALDPLGTQHAAVEREVLPRLEADHRVALHLELDAALLATEAAVRFYQLVWGLFGAAARACGEVRPEGARDQKIVDRKLGHGYVDSVQSAPCASPNIARRQAGQIS